MARVGDKRLGPGVWTDDAGYLHFDVPTMLAAFALENTAANRAIVLAMIRDVVAEELPHCAIVELGEPAGPAN